MGVIKFLHALFKPNCDCNICARPSCNKCEVLELQLSYERSTNQQLINTLINLVNPVSEPQTIERKEVKSIQKATIPWRVKQQMLETEDRHAAKLRDDKLREQEANRMTTAEL